MPGVVKRHVFVALQEPLPPPPWSCQLPDMEPPEAVPV